MISQIVVVVLVGIAILILVPPLLWRALEMKIEKASGHVALWLRRRGIINW
ncbi:MAG: hypothetical protein WCP17_02905 [bacterium]